MPARRRRAPRPRSRNSPDKSARGMPPSSQQPGATCIQPVFAQPNSPVRSRQPAKPVLRSGAVRQRRPDLQRSPSLANKFVLQDGEHTDYNLGFVLPAAIDLYCWVALSPRPDRQLHVYSTNFETTVSVDLDDPHLTSRGDWSDYVVGTGLALEHHGYKIQGANILVSGQVPMGSGLSSSAAIEVSTGYSLISITPVLMHPIRPRPAGGRKTNSWEPVRHHGSVYFAARPGRPRVDAGLSFA